MFFRTVRVSFSFVFGWLVVMHTIFVLSLLTSKWSRMPDSYHVSTRLNVYDVSSPCILMITTVSGKRVRFASFMPKCCATESWSVDLFKPLTVIDRVLSNGSAMYSLCRQRLPFSSLLSTTTRSSSARSVGCHKFWCFFCQCRFKCRLDLTLIKPFACLCHAVCHRWFDLCYMQWTGRLCNACNQCRNLLCLSCASKLQILPFTLNSEFGLFVTFLLRVLYSHVR